MTYPFAEDNCPGHVGTEGNPRICARCGVDSRSLAPDPEELDYDDPGIGTGRYVGVSVSGYRGTDDG